MVILGQDPYHDDGQVLSIPFLNNECVCNFLLFVFNKKYSYTYYVKYIQ